MPIKARLALSFLVLAGLALAPAAATAKSGPGYVVYPAHKELEFGGGGSNGYGLVFSGDSRGGASVSAGETISDVTYELPARVRGNRFEVHYGNVIDVSVTFHPRPGRRLWPEHPLHGPCVGRKSVIRHGEFVGTIEFHGALGYTELVTTRLGGDSEHAFKRVCPKRSGRRATGSSADLGPRQIVAARPEGGAETWFRALAGFPTLKPSPRWTFEARRAERVGRVRIGRMTILEAETGAVLSPRGVSLVTAEVTPPAPFAGSAEFRQDAAGATSWTGSLGIDFPGLGVVPLTGEGFTAVSCVGGERTMTRPCERSPLAPGYP